MRGPFRMKNHSKMWKEDFRTAIEDAQRVVRNTCEPDNMLILPFPPFDHYGVMSPGLGPRESAETRIYDTMVAVCSSGELDKHQLIRLASRKQQADRTRPQILD